MSTGKVRGLLLLASKLGKDVGKPGAGNLDSEHRPGRLPDGVARARADQDPASRAVQAEQSGSLKSCWAASFIPAQHVLLVVEATEEVCEEIGEEGNNFGDRGNDKHAAKKHKNL